MDFARARKGEVALFRRESTKASSRNSNASVDRLSACDAEIRTCVDVALQAVVGALTAPDFEASDAEQQEKLVITVSEALEVLSRSALASTTALWSGEESNLKTKLAEMKEAYEARLAHVRKCARVWAPNHRSSADTAH